jgi:hypothetical protein
VIEAGVVGGGGDAAAAVMKVLLLLLLLALRRAADICCMSISCAPPQMWCAVLCVSCSLLSAAAEVCPIIKASRAAALAHESPTRGAVAGGPSIPPYPGLRQRQSSAHDLLALATAANGTGSSNTCSSNKMAAAGEASFVKLLLWQHTEHTGRQVVDTCCCCCFCW